MEDAAHGYYTGSTYTKAVQHGYDPRRLSALGRSLGYDTADPNQPFTFADFGCGYGLTILMLAKALPHGQFFGIDLIPEHTAASQRFAKMIGVTNVTYINAAFDDVTPGMLPPLDFAMSHGVFSWIAPEVRQHLRKAVTRALKPRGIFAASYNLLPGWAEMLPLRALLKTAVDRGADDSAAVSLLHNMVVERATQSGKAAPNLLRTFRPQDMPYVRHEFLNEHWVCFTHQDLAAEMAADGLRFAGPFHALPSDRAAGEGALHIDDPLFWEDFKAAATAATFRTSVFVSADAPAAGQAKPFAEGHATVAPSMNISPQSLLGKDLLGDKHPRGSVSLAAIGQKAADTGAMQELSLLLNSETLVPLTAGFEPIGTLGRFVHSSDLTEQIAHRAQIETRSTSLILPWTGGLVRLPARMWQILTHCAGKSVEDFVDIIEAVMPSDGSNVQPAEVAVRNWHVRWAPWLAGQGAIRPMDRH